MNFILLMPKLVIYQVYFKYNCNAQKKFSYVPLGIMAKYSLTWRTRDLNLTIPNQSNS